MRTGVVEVGIVVGLYALMSAATFAAYGRDKRAAMRGTRRTPEGRLQVMALCFGWPGAWVGRRVFRHKTMKRGFTAVFWVIGVVHGIAWVCALAFALR